VSTNPWAGNKSWYYPHHHVLLHISIPYLCNTRRDWLEHDHVT
jgi:hypothetical protein